MSHTSNSHNQPPSTPVTLSRLALAEDEDINVQVSVLVTMPSPTFKSSFNPNGSAEGEMLPEIAVGVVQLPYCTSPSANASILKGD
jgi:hypothetical protein